MTLANNRKETETTNWIIGRNESLARAGKGILRAREALDRLEEILNGTVSGAFAKPEEVVHWSSELRHEVNEAVIGLIESSCLPAAERSALARSPGPARADTDRGED